MDKKQVKGALVLLLVTAVFLGALSFASDGGPQTLTGSGKGYAGDVVVEVVVDGDVIKSITVVESNDTPGLSDDAFDTIIAAVLKNQSVEGVDVVSGATGSSNGILDAIRAALASSAPSGPVTYTGSGTGYAGEVVVQVTMEGGIITAIEVVESSDTPGLSDGAFDDIIAAVLEQQSLDGIDVVSGATASSNGILEALANAMPGAGGETGAAVEGDVYTGSGTGYAGQVTVEVTVADGQIVGIGVVESSDTPGLSDSAFDEVIAAVLSSQSVEGIDAVSGATGSSEGILEAIGNAMAAAGLAPIEGDVYSGSGTGYAGQVTVEVIISDGEMVAINVVESSDTPGLSDSAFDEIIAAVLANQSVEGVDMIAGATGSSEGILEAINNALSAIVGEVVVEGDVFTGSGQGYDSTITVEVIVADGEIVAINVVEANDTPGLSDSAFDEIIAAVLANQSVEGVDVIAGATGSSNGILNAIEEALAQQ